MTETVHKDLCAWETIPVLRFIQLGLIYCKHVRSLTSQSLILPFQTWIQF